MSKAHLSPIEVYKLLPRTNCKECGEENCMAFATKLVNREVVLDQCLPLVEKKDKTNYLRLWELLKPPVKEIIIGTGNAAVKIGGKEVMYRHELTYVNQTVIAIDVTDEMEDDEFEKRVKGVEEFSYTYIGMNLSLDMVAIRSTSNDPKKFNSTVKKFVETSSLPAILCSFNPEVIENGLLVLGKKRPLIYAATKDNWRDMADLALMYNCPLAVFAPNDLTLLKSLTRTLFEYGVEDLVIDPGTFPHEGLSDTINNFTMLRKAAIREGDELLGFPLLGVPLTAWIGHEGAPEVAIWNETWLASMLIARYADIMIMHSLDGWSQLPLTVLRKNLYTDPRKPVAVESGLRTFGEPNEASPLLFTTNFALTYYTVASDIESNGVDCYLLVVDSDGLSVESSVAGRKLTADKIAEALREIKAESVVKHKSLIIPGRA
ncbi:MAG: acetyl-CoA decarbonylase/synthase complex subunit gamma, partial [Candidatus Bathyarchaeia archaeon]